MELISLQAIPNQELSVVLDGQNCIIHIYQKGEYMYMDLTSDGTPVRQGMICLCNISLLQYPTADFSGTLFFSDTTQADEAPEYSGLGTRFLLFFQAAEK